MRPAACTRVRDAAAGRMTAAGQVMVNGDRQQTENAGIGADARMAAAGAAADGPAARSVPARIVGWLILLFARFVTAVRATWKEPPVGQQVYFANHASHGDFILIWTVLPPRLRRHTRPVAGADYWLTSRIKRFIGQDVFNAVLIQRGREGRERDPIEQMAEALDSGASLIVFPEGTRNLGEKPLQPFRSGLYFLARARPQIDLVPVWINNLNRVMPKGEVLPVPLICTVSFGAALHLAPNETQHDFIARAETALRSLAPNVSAS